MSSPFPLKKTQAGNVLFMILIAVALFAALSYAITKSGRGGGSVDREQEMLAAAQLIQYAGWLQQGVQRLVLTNRCTDITLNFGHSQFPFATQNPDAPADGSCDVFGPNGANVSFPAPPPVLQASNLIPFQSVSSYLIKGDFGIDGVGTTAGDILLTAHVTRDMCVAINNKVGIPNPGGEPPDPCTAPASGGQVHISQNAGAAVSNQYGTGDIGVEAGIHMGCVNQGCPGSGDYGFYSVVLAR